MSAGMVRRALDHIAQLHNRFIVSPAIEERRSQFKMGLNLLGGFCTQPLELLERFICTACRTMRLGHTGLLANDRGKFSQGGIPLALFLTECAKIETGINRLGADFQSGLKVLFGSVITADGLERIAQIVVKGGVPRAQLQRAQLGFVHTPERRGPTLPLDAARQPLEL